MKILILSALIAAVFALNSYAGVEADELFDTISEAEFLDGGGSKEDFRQIDVTGKGYFTVDEAKVSAVDRKFWSLFDGPDKNGDGAITKAEFQESVIHSVKNAKSAPPTLGD